MRQREVTPRYVIGLKGVQELSFIRSQPDGSLAIGAMTTVRAIECSLLITGKYDFLSQTAAEIGSPEIRWVATIGGNLSGALPCADFALLVPLKRSRPYATIRPRVADLRPVDAWEEDNLHYFVFRLTPADPGAPPPAEAPLAVFVMQPGTSQPVSAVVVTGREGQAEVSDLLRPGDVRILPLLD